MRWAGNVARMKENAYRLLMTEPERKKLERTRLGGWIILKCILQRQNGVLWVELVWLRIGSSVMFL
jgi:hypothetical protein